MLERNLDGGGYMKTHTYESQFDVTQDGVPDPLQSTIYGQPDASLDPIANLQIFPAAPNQHIDLTRNSQWIDVPGGVYFEPSQDAAPETGKHTHVTADINGDNIEDYSIFYSKDDCKTIAMSNIFIRPLF